jgi:hypothetical protein
MVDLKALVPWRDDRNQRAESRGDFLDPFVALRREMDRAFHHFCAGAVAQSGNGWQTVTPASCAADNWRRDATTDHAAGCVRGAVLRQLSRRPVLPVRRSGKLPAHRHFQPTTHACAPHGRPLVVARASSAATTRRDEAGLGRMVEREHKPSAC